MKESHLQTTTTRGKSHGKADVLHHACPKTQSLQKVSEKPLALWLSSITEYLLGLPHHSLQRIPHPLKIPCMDGRLAEEQEREVKLDGIGGVNILVSGSAQIR